jgi:hypothetical protein
MAFKITIATYDVSDYATACGEIPIVERNLDYSIIASEFSMSVAETFTAHTIVADDEVLFYIDSASSYPVFVGIVKEVVFDYESRTYDVNVASVVSKMKSKTVTYANLHSSLIDTANDNYYKAVDNQGYPNVNVLWVMKKMCLQCGIDLDISSLESVGTGFYEEKFISSLGVTRQFYISDLKFDENMLYALNQDEVGNHTIWEALISRIRKSPTYFELFSMLMSYLGLTLTWSQNGTTKQLRLALKDNSYEKSFTDDLTYLKKIGAMDGSDEGVSWIGNFSARSGYASGTGSPYTEQFSNGYLDKVEDLAVWTNFLMIYRDSRLSYTDGKTFAYAGGATHENGDGCASYSVMLANKQNAICSNWQTYEVESSIDLTGVNLLLRMAVDVGEGIATYEGTTL